MKDHEPKGLVGSLLALPLGVKLIACVGLSVMAFNAAVLFGVSKKAEPLQGESVRYGAYRELNELESGEYESEELFPGYSDRQYAKGDSADGSGHCYKWGNQWWQGPKDCYPNIVPGTKCGCKTCMKCMKSTFREHYLAKPCDWRPQPDEFTPGFVWRSGFGCTLNDIFENIIVIMCCGKDAKRQAITQHLADMHVGYTIMEGWYTMLHGWERTAQEMRKYYRSDLSEKEFFDLYTKEVNQPGQPGASISHHRAIDKAAASGTPGGWSLILEMDARITEGAEQFHAFFQELLTRRLPMPDLVYFGYCWEHGKRAAPDSLIFLDSKAVCAHGYAISTEGAKKVVAKRGNMKKYIGGHKLWNGNYWEIDVVLRQMCRWKDLTCYHAAPMAWQVQCDPPLKPDICYGPDEHGVWPADRIGYWGRGYIVQNNTGTGQSANQDGRVHVRENKLGVPKAQGGTPPPSARSFKRKKGKGGNPGGKG